MEKPHRVAATIKSFLRQALPKEGARHVLALGEVHTGTSNSTWIGNNLPELEHEHNTGTLGLENTTLYNIFTWAYRDGKLPVAAGEAVPYLKNILSMLKTPLANLDTLTAQEKQIITAMEAGRDAKVDLMCKAVDRGIDVVHFDARDYTLEEGMQTLEAHVDLMRNAIEDPVIRDDLRRHPENIKRIAAFFLEEPNLRDSMTAAGVSTDPAVFTRNLAVAFVYLEAKQLLDDHPQYQRRYDNIAAVLDAGKKHELGYDALSAAILTGAARPDKNIISTSGLLHLMGTPALSGRKGLDGTFAQHIAAQPLPVSTAMITSEAELATDIVPYFGENGTVRQAYSQLGVPALDLPPILRPEKDTILRIKELGDNHAPDTAEYALHKSHASYKPTDTPTTTVRGPEYIATMQAKLESPEMAGLLGKLRER